MVKKVKSKSILIVFKIFSLPYFLACVKGSRLG
jgi:hypothetical protein